MTPTTRIPESVPEGPVHGDRGPNPPKGGKPKWRALIWVVFLLAIAGVAAYAVYHAGDPTTAPKGGGGGGGRGAGGRGGTGPVPVVSAKVSRASIPVYLNGLGNVSPYYTVVIKSRVDGQLMKVHFNEGELVKEGQVLAEIDPRPFQIQLDLTQ